MIRSLALIIVLQLAAGAAFGQGAVLQGGPMSPGHTPQYYTQGTGQAVIGDSGPAKGGDIGSGLSELNITSRGTGTGPFANTGTGPWNTHGCLLDTYLTSPAGYHYICFDPNAQGGGLIAVGANNGAAALPFNMIVNGTTYQFPFTASGAIVGPATTVIGDIATWNNTLGTVLADTPPLQVFGTKSANTFMAGPTSGAAAFPTFRAIVNADFGTQSANVVFAGPTSGGAVAPSWRPLVAGDVPQIASSSLDGLCNVNGDLLVRTAGTWGCGSSVAGPATSTVGNLAAWNSTLGTVLKDGGVPVSVLTSGSANQIPVYPGGGASIAPTTVGGSGGFFDTICSSTIGQAWVRLTSGWGCLSLGFVNPVWWGAVADGATSDLAAFNSAIAAISSGGVLYVPFFNTGSYCMGAGLNITTANVRIELGSGEQSGVSLRSCGSGSGTTATTLTLNAFNDSLYWGHIVGPAAAGGVSPTGNAITLGSSCVECVIFWPRVTGGSNGILAQGADFHIIGGHYEQAYGSAVVMVTGGGYMQRMKRDQNYPAGANCSSIGNWAATTSVTANQCLLVSSNFYVQVTVNGTTGGGPPALPAYNAAVTDGSATEKLLAPATYYGLQCDAGSICVDSDGDNTGPYTYGACECNANAGTAPQLFTLDRIITGNGLTGGILLSAGAGAVIANSQISACGNPSTCDGVDVAAAYQGTFTIIGNKFFSNPGTNIKITGSGGTPSAYAVIADNHILGGASLGIEIGAKVIGVDIHDNTFNSPVWSAPTNWLTLDSGASDYIQAHNNNVNGAGSLSNSSTGAHNRVQDNPGYNPVGATAAANVCASPCTITAGPSPETHYLKQTATNTATVTVGGQQIATLVGSSTYYDVNLGPNESMVVTWTTTTPTDTKFVH